MDGTFDTINTAFWDSMAGCYRSYTRMFADVTVAIEWQNDKPNGHIEVINGEFGDGRLVFDQGTLKK